METRTIGTFLSALRKASGLTQKQLAEKLNVSDKAVSRWERDECSPDLSLIPVLAEIYGVTSDEILRGQRRNPDTEPAKNDTIKTDRLRKHLVAKTQSRFRIRSLINLGIAIIGMVIACICNFELNEANIGFLLGILFFGAAAFSQIISAVSAFSALREDEWTDLSLTNCKGSILLQTQLIISVICLMLTATFPFAGKSHTTVSFFDCFIDALPCILITASICYVVSLVVNLIVFRKLRSGKNCLRMICSSAMAVLMIGLLVGQIFLNNSLMVNRHEYAPCKEYKTLRSFKAAIEHSFAPDGNTMYKDGYNANGRIFYISETDSKLFLAEDEIVKQLIEKEIPAGYYEGDRFIEEYGYQFEHLNRYIAYYELSDNEKMVPIYVFTTDQLEEANRIALGRHGLYVLLYLIPIALGASVYLILRRKYA